MAGVESRSAFYENKTLRFSDVFSTGDKLMCDARICKGLLWKTAAVFVSLLLTASLMPGLALADDGLPGANDAVGQDSAQGASVEDALVTADDVAGAVSAELGADGSAYALDAGKDSIVDFFYIGERAVPLGAEEPIAIGFSASIDAERCTLFYEGPDGVEASVDAEVLLPDAASFILRFGQDSALGDYRLLRVEWDGPQSGAFDIPCTDDGVSFSVIEPEDGEECSGITVSTIDESGELVEAASIDEALDESDGGAALAEEIMSADASKARAYGARAGGKSMVIVLDPGHGGSDSGATNGSVYEKNLTLSIASHCRDSLNRYSGVTTYMTRTGDSSVSLDERANYAKRMGADLFVSFHINSSESSSPSGYEVWVQNDSSYRQDLHNESYGLGQAVLDKLKQLGLHSRGIKYDDYVDPVNKYYPDGSPADGLSVLRNNRLNGIPAILIEHGFIRNGNDFSYLSSDANRVKLGQADAEAIAEYYGLRKGPVPSVSQVTEDGAVTLSWEPVPDASKYAVAIYRDGKYSLYTTDCYGTSYTIGERFPIGSACTVLVQAYVDGRWTSDDASQRFTFYVIPTPKPQASPSGDGQVRLSWQPVPGAQAYAVAKYEGGRYSVLTSTLPASAASYTVGNLGNGYEHAFLVQAKVGGRWSSDSTSLLVRATPTGTTKPGNVTATAGSGSVSLSWSAVPGAERYAVSTRNPDGTYNVRTTSVTGLAHTLTGLANGTAYDILVQAYVCGAWSRYDDSDLVRATPADPASPKPQASPSGDGQVRLSWQPVPGAQAYAVAKYEGGRYSVLTSTLPASAASYTVGNLGNGYEHAFLVQAKVGGRWSSDSTSLLVRATPTGTTKPGNVTATAGAGRVDLSWAPVPGATKYAVSTKNANGSYTVRTTSITRLSYTLTGLTGGVTYDILVQAYVCGAWSRYTDADLVRATPNGYLIMGRSNCTVGQMVAYFKQSGHSYPSATYSKYGAPTIERFCELVLQQANSEGVRAEVLFCQAMKETGWLRFGGDVKPDQCNFGGIGATGGGVAGNSFPNVATGLLAQAQHLKAYATTASLNNPCVDPRYQYVVKGCAPYVEWLGSNPNGYGWATAENYGNDILLMINRLQSL